MATRTRRVVETAADDDETQETWGTPIPLAAAALETAPEDDDQTSVERVSMMLENASAAGSAQVRVYRIGERDTDVAWCNTYSIEEFESGGDLALVRNQFGAGRYSIRIYGQPQGTKRKVILSRLDTEIIADPNPRPAPNPAPTLGDSSALGQALQLLVEGQRAMMERLMAPPPPAPPPVDPVASMRSTLDLMVLMRSAMGVDTQPKSQIGEIVAAMRELREASNELNPSTQPPDETSQLLGLGGQVLDLVKGAVQPRPSSVIAPVVTPPSLAFPPIPQTTPVHQAPQLAVAPNPAPAPHPDPEPPEPTMTPEQAREAAAHVQSLIADALGLATSGAPPEKGAELLYGTEDRPGLPDELFEAMMLDSWWALLTSDTDLAALLTPHEAWIRAVRDLMVSWEAQDAEIGDAPAAPQAATNAAPDPAKR